LLVTTEKPPRLLLVDTHSRKVVRDFDVQGSNPHMVTLSRGTGYAFVSNTESGAVAAVRLSDGKLTLIPTAARPQGSVLSQDRSLLYVTNTGAARITVIDPLNLKVVKELPIGKGAGRIALAPDGNTLIYNLQEDQGVGFLDIATGRQTFFLPLHGRPLSLTLSRDGRRAFAGVQDQDKIFELSVPERKVLRVIAAPKDAGPDPAISLE
jgi:streptogramin lyase